MLKQVTGTVYDIVDKTTGEVVKVGSTIRTLAKRFNENDYQPKYRGCCILAFKTIQSSELDWYDDEDVNCPFLWHLLASEQIHILNANTFHPDKKFANKVWPLEQKHNGFEGGLCSRIGGLVGGRKHKESGHWDAVRNSPKAIAGRRTQSSLNAQNGHMNRIARIAVEKKAGIHGYTKQQTKENSRKGGLLGGVTNFKNKTGMFARTPEKISEDARKSGQLGGMKTSQVLGHMSKAGKIGGKSEGTRHIRWHVNRKSSSVRCSMCSEQNLVVAFA